MVAVLAGAVGSLYLMFRVGQRNPSRLLLAMFTGWVLAPFVALAWCHVAAKRWSEFANTAVQVVSLVVALGSLLVYGYIAFGPPRAQPAFFFLVVPFVSLLLIAIVALLRGKKVPEPNDPTEPSSQSLGGSS